ncbi:hypothetical protein [Nocardia bhagyanarayanae]|uniref:Uncharacterized protein n=1 Tax=Nocardia bhagyanarayanae TaxID=1215925 RepID=A0A543F7Y1_9NOCA|nr:hypothetical protein [Nocardia bhagyanarayanae]TQM29933.1 hypothetical protein FB390_1547 [Nocardia bhagyanarayanae]
MTRSSDDQYEPEDAEVPAETDATDDEHKHAHQRDSDLMPDTPGMLGDEIDEMSHPDKPSPS